MCMAHIFNWLQLHSHPFLTHIAQLFFPITEKSNHQSSLKLNIWFSNVAPHNKAASNFCNAVARGNIKKCKCIARFVFIYQHCAANWESRSTKICRQPWWQPNHRTWFKRMHWMPFLVQFWWCITPNPPIAQNLLLPKKIIFTQIRGVCESPHSKPLGRKTGPFLTLPTPVSHSLHHHWMKEVGSVFCCKKQCEFFDFTNLHTKISQNTHLFPCHLSPCSYKHATIN